VVTLSKELYAPLDQKLLRNLGFTATDLIEVANWIIATWEDRLNTRFKTLQRIFRERKVARIVRMYFKLMTGISGDPEEFIRQLPNLENSRRGGGRDVSSWDRV
jgi:hypothetical protein